MLPLKEALYDWGGANLWLFKAINGIDGGYVYTQAMIWISRLTDHEQFPYYLIALVVFALCSYVIRKIRRRGGSKQSLAAWIGVLAVLIVGYGVNGLAIKLIKSEFAYPRPYVVLGKAANILDPASVELDKSHQSFPSGHVAFFTMIIIGLWPIFPEGSGKWWLLLIAIVGWSRVAGGVHFPADAVGAFLITACIIILLRNFLYLLIRRMFGLRC